MASSAASLISLLLDREKRVEPLPERLDAALFSDFDLVLCDRIAASDGLARSRSDYLAFVRSHARAVWLTLSPFGFDGPYAGYAGGELVAAASGGLLATIAPKEGGRPALIPGQQALKSTGWVWTSGSGTEPFCIGTWVTGGSRTFRNRPAQGSASAMPLAAPLLPTSTTTAYSKSW